MRCTLRQLADQIGVEDVALVQREVRVVRELRLRQRIPMEVVDRDDLVPIDELARERRADEARAAGDDHAFALERHRASLAR